MWWRKKREKVFIAKISGDAFIALEQLTEKMNANSAKVLGCALSLLAWMVQHVDEGGELVGQNGTEEFDIVITYRNRQGQEVCIPPKNTQDNATTPRKSLRLSQDDKTFFKKLGIEPD